MKFFPGRKLLDGSASAEFNSFKAAQRSPLARALFRHSDVKNVLVGGDFIAVTVTDTAQWPILKPQIFASLENFFASGQPILDDGTTVVEPNLDTKILDSDDDTTAMIKELIETRIRPYIQEDGGDIVYHGFRDGYVHLQLQGSCVGCPSSSVTLKGGIESMLMHYCPEVKGVKEFIDEPVEQASRDQLDKLEGAIKQQSDS